MSQVDLFLEMLRTQTLKTLPIGDWIKIYLNRYTKNIINIYINNYIDIILKNRNNFVIINNYIVSYELKINFKFTFLENNYNKIMDKMVNDYVMTNLRIKVIVRKILFN